MTFTSKRMKGEIAWNLKKGFKKKGGGGGYQDHIKVEYKTIFICKLGKGGGGGGRNQIINTMIAFPQRRSKKSTQPCRLFLQFSGVPMFLFG